MAFGNLSPFTWRPTNKPRSPGLVGTPIGNAGNVGAGDWCQVLLSFRTGSTPVLYATDRFLIHVVYTPNSDDSTPQADQMVTYGGSEQNQRRSYRIDPGVTFQVPFDGQLSIVAGAESPETCIVDVLLNKAVALRDGVAAAVALQEIEQRAAYGDPGALNLLQGFNPMQQFPAPRMYPPPIVGTPQLVHATWVDVPIATAIPFPDGAEFMEVVNDTGVVGSPTRLTIAALGGAFALNCASGILRTIGSFGQGSACSNGTPATWTTPVALQSATVWSRLGG